MVLDRRRSGAYKGQNQPDFAVQNGLGRLGFYGMCGAIFLPISHLGGIAAAAQSAGPVPAVLFYLFSGTTVAAAFSVAIARNIVRAAVGLMFALAGMSGLYLMLNAEFIAAVQLVVYVGGTLILIVFGVMLTSKSPNTAYSPKRWEVLWATVITLLVALPLVVLMTTARFRLKADQPEVAAATIPAVDVAATSAAKTTSDAMANRATGELGDRYAMKTLGKALLEPSGFLVPFELVSVVLLAVMIGAAYLAKGRVHKTADEGGAK
jgi:NADH-quinone oxidoreductase subunit J